MKMFLFILLIGLIGAIDWIALHKLGGPDSLNPTRQPANAILGKYDLCNHIPDERFIQKKLCYGYPSLMGAIVTATKQTKLACENAMHDKRWDCSTLKYAPKFKRDLRKGTSERAFVHSLSSAAVGINVAKRCALGDLDKCGCSDRPQDDHLDEKVSRPCEHDLDWANSFSRQWTDAPIHSSNAKKRYRLMYQLDNTAGRKMASQSMHIVCKCHGVSGSCTDKTCWKVTPSVDEVAMKLKYLYSKSVKVEPQRLEQRDIQNQLQMVYVDQSHDYCEKNNREGSMGTQGRECDPYGYGDGSCKKLCCGRGFRTERETVINTQHNCRYVWCCRVECETIEETRIKHVCK